MFVRILFVLIICTTTAVSYAGEAEVGGDKPKLTVTYAESENQSDTKPYARPLSDKNILPAALNMPKRPPRDKMHKGEKRKDFDWVDKLNMSEEQKNQLNAIQKESAKKKEEIEKQMYVLHQKMEEVQTEELKNIRLILTEKQQKKFDKYIKRQQRQKPPRLPYGDVPKEPTVDKP